MDGRIWCFIRKNKTALSLLLILSLLCANPQILANAGAESQNAFEENEAGKDAEDEAASDSEDDEEIQEPDDEDELEDERLIARRERASNEASAISDGTPVEIVKQLEDDELSLFVGHGEALSVIVRDTDPDADEGRIQEPTRPVNEDMQKIDDAMDEEPQEIDHSTDEETQKEAQSLESVEDTDQRLDGGDRDTEQPSGDEKNPDMVFGNGEENAILPSGNTDEKEDAESLPGNAQEDAGDTDPTPDMSEESVPEELAGEIENTDERPGGDTEYLMRDVETSEGDIVTFAGDDGEDYPTGSADALGLQIHYVSENDQYYVTKNSNFNLKCQIDFTADTFYRPGEVKIRIPAMLFEDRGGTPVKPADIGVSEGTVEKPTKNPTSAFNYYYETIDGVEYITFFNYDLLNMSDIVSIQVLYKSINVMNVIDGSAWDLPATATVYEGSENESVYTTENHVEGKVDTNATVDQIKKIPEPKVGSHYPELYTQRQVESVLGRLPDIISGDNFNKYKYVMWRIEAKGTGNQPADIILDECSYTYVNGKLVEGIVLNSGFQKSGNQYEKILESNCQSSDWTYNEQKNSAIKIVVAYPVDKLDNTKVYNKATIRVVPLDSPQKENEMTGEAECVYHDYEWQYPGDTYKVEKSGLAKVRTGGFNAYKISSENGEDFVSLPFTSKATMKGYGATHYTDAGSGHERGDYRAGTGYTMFLQDAATYAADENNTDQETYTLLDGNDYYFNSVIINSKKTGYDVFEDVETMPVYHEADTGVIIYAMYGDSPGAWSKVATAAFDDKGSASYTFTDGQIAKHPYRIKCEVTSTEYSVDLSINVNTMLKANSPNIAKLIKNANGTYNSVGSLKIMDYSAFGAVFKESGRVVKVYGNDKTAASFPKDAPSSLKKMIKTKQGIPCNDSDANFDGYMIAKGARDVIRSMYETSQMSKKYTLSNDPTTGRANVKYYIGALDGYYIEDKSDKDYLEGAGASSPVRDEVVFYDLLPYGMAFDPSVPITAGRLDGRTEFERENALNKAQVSVIVDSAKDVISNYNNTGRTLLIFHLKYSGGDAGVYQSHKWCENWGLVFGAYYEWKDKKAAGNGVNIAAFMPEAGDNIPLLGDASSNDGSYIQKDLKIDESNKAMLDYIMGARSKSEGSKRNVLYAQCRINEDIATSETMGVYKYVRSDDDRFGTFSKSAFVDPMKGYSYNITVKNTRDAMSNIVLFDRLEAESESQWRGNFEGIVTTELENQGIKPVIYYSASPAAPLPTSSLRASAVLTASNGWYTAEQFKSQGHSLSEVRSVAVDVSKKTDNSDFLLAADNAIGIRIKMKAPDGGALNKNALNTTMYAAVRYQDSAYIVSDPSDATIVTLGKPIDMVVEKHITEKTPENKRDTKFSFSVTDDNGYAYANKEYYLYEKANGTWERLSGLYSTSSVGGFEIKPNQRAVFKDVNEVNRLNVSETDDLFWECHVSDTRDTQDGGVVGTTDEEGNLVYRRTIDFSNTYHPLLFMSKKVKNVPNTVNVQDYTFKFQISVNGKTEFEEGLEYVYVVKERRDGISPQVNEAPGDGGYARTDKNGFFTLHVGETIAFNRMFAGDEYVIKEILPKDADFLCAKDSVKGTLKDITSSASIENNYRYRDLDLKKELTSQNIDECSQEFTFRICASDNSAHIAADGKKYNGTAMSGYNWVVLDENGEETAEGGTLSADGEFTYAAAGKTIRIKGLDAGVKYTVTETDSGENYRPSGSGSISVTMPENGTKKAASVTNDYLLRDFKVTKKVYYNEEDAADTELALSKEFTMNAQINGSPLAKCEYRIQENGVILTDDSGGDIVKRTDADGNFTIKHGQTAIFKEAGKVGQSYKVTESPDADYQQSFPTDIYGNVIPSEGYLSNMENEAVICNGFYGLDTSSKIIISKNITSGDSQTSKDYLALLKDSGAEGFDARRRLAASYMNVEITASDGKKYALPDNLECVMLDEWKNVTQTIPVSNILAGADGKVINILPGWSVSVTASQLSTALFGEGSPYTVTSVSVTEAGTGYQHVVYNDRTDASKEYTVAIGQVTPAEDAALTKKILSGGVTLFEITNQLDVLEDAGSVIQKKMTFGSKSVPKGSTLVWQVQRYTGGKWIPADGVKYFVDTRSSGTSVSRDTPLLTTGKDGKLVLKKTDSGMPKVQFMEKVYLNRTTPTEGDLQVVELLEESDDSWGYLAGYGRKKSGNYEYDMTYSSETDDSVKYFINTNNFSYVKVQKEMEESADDTFSMVVRRVTKLDDNSGRMEVKESSVASGIAYDVYDARTNHLLRSGVTGSDGVFNIMAGQYANLKIPNDLYFTVQEKIAPNYNMVRLTASDKNALTQLKDNISEGANDDNSNSMLIKTAGEPVSGQDTELTHDDFLNGITNAITDETLNMSKALDTGISEIVIPEYFYRPGDSTLYHLVGVEGGSEATPTCDFRNSYNPLTDPPGAAHIKSLSLPDSVKGVGDYAFAFGEGLESVHLSETLTSIGNSALRTYGGDYAQNTNYVKMNLPDSIEKIGEYGLALESPLVEEDITWKSIKISPHAFGLNAVIDGSISIEKGKISDYAFGNTVITKEAILTDCSISPASFDMSTDQYKDKVFPYLDKTHLYMTITGGGTEFGGLKMSWGGRVIDKLSIGGNGLTNLDGDDQFNYMPVIELELLEGVEEVGFRTFARLTGTNVYYDGQWGDVAVKKITIPSTIKEFKKSRTFGFNKFLTDVIWKEGTTNISGGYLFGGDYELKNITLPSTLKEIGAYMFQNCSALESIEIPAGVTDIKKCAFDKVPITSIDLPEGLLNIGTFAFQGTALESIKLPDSLQTISYTAFMDTAIDFYSLKLPEGTKTVY